MWTCLTLTHRTLCGDHVFSARYLPTLTIGEFIIGAIIVILRRFEKACPYEV